MSGFDTRWLDLREPADHAARDPGLLRAFAEALPGDARITDLACGTGSTLRALAPVLPNARWRLLDHDPALLAEAQRRAPAAEVAQVDLAADLESALADGSDAITASALIDLVSRDWLERLVAAAAGRVIYIALSYTGEEIWQPEHPGDTTIFDAFQAHQRGDKGFGPALGPGAAGALAGLLSGDWTVTLAPSPWRLRRAEHGDLMNELAAGIAKAAVEAGVSDEVAQRWRAARRSAESCFIGHCDLLAIPLESAAQNPSGKLIGGRPRGNS